MLIRSARRRAIACIDVLEPRRLLSDVAMVDLQAWYGETTIASMIPVTDHRDLVMDEHRGQLLIVGHSGRIERYDIAADRLLDPVIIEGQLSGTDITPDGRFLFATDSAISNGEGVIHRIDLGSGLITRLTYPLTPHEGGSWDIAVLGTGVAYVTADAEAGYTAPLRDLNIETGEIRVVTGIDDEPPRADLARSGDRGTMVLRAWKMDGSHIALLDVASGQWTTQSIYSSNDPRLLVNSDGSLISSASQLFDRSLRPYGSAAPKFKPVAFDP